MSSKLSALPAASALSAGDRLYVDQAGTSAAIVLTAAQANLLNSPLAPVTPIVYASNFGADFNVDFPPGAAMASGTGDFLNLPAVQSYLLVCFWSAFIGYGGPGRTADQNVTTQLKKINGTPGFIGVSTQATLASIDVLINDLQFGLQVQPFIYANPSVNTHVQLWAGVDANDPNAILNNSLVSIIAYPLPL